MMRQSLLLLLWLCLLVVGKECDKQAGPDQKAVPVNQELCQHCGGRVMLTGPSGFVTDGPGNYNYKTKCTWLIEGRPKTVLRLRFHHFATECNWDNLYVYDGDSIYAPLVAAFSGLIVPEKENNKAVPEVAITSGYAFLHFYSDAAYAMSGFNISYSIDTCPNNCSGRGMCAAGNGTGVYCDCAENWKGESCDIPYCLDSCGEPERGVCNLNGTKGCVCYPGWQGPGCSVPVPANQSFWTREEFSFPQLARASHKAVVVDDVMWIVGGYMFNHSNYQMVMAYDLVYRMWLPLSSSANSIAARYGHSLVGYKDKLYMYGGKVDTTGKVTDQLWMFNVQNASWAQLFPKGKERYSVVGHSAHIVNPNGGGPVMLVFFGYSPLYSFINNVQQYDFGQQKKAFQQRPRKVRRDVTSPQHQTQEETEEVLPVPNTPSQQPEQIDVESQEDVQPSDAVPGPSCPVVLSGQTSPDPSDHERDESGGVPVFCPNHTFPRCTIGRMSADILQCCKELEEIKEAATALQHRMGYLVDMLAKF